MCNNLNASLALDATRTVQTTASHNVELILLRWATNYHPGLTASAARLWYVLSMYSRLWKMKIPLSSHQCAACKVKLSGSRQLWSSGLLTIRGRPKVEIPLPLSAVTESKPKVTYHIRPKPYVPPKVKRDFRPKTETETESQSYLSRHDYRSQ